MRKTMATALAVTMICLGLTVGIILIGGVVISGMAIAECVRRYKDFRKSV